MDDFNPSIRTSALQKLATLAVNAPEYDDQSDIAQLTQQCQHLTKYSDSLLNGVLQSQSPVSRVPMDIRELGVLVALCKAAPSVTRAEHASRLVSQLSQYLPESHGQLFRPSPFLHDVKPSPWEILSYNLTFALLSLGSEYPSLREAVLTSVNDYLYNCGEAIKALSPDQRADSGENVYGTAYESVSILSISVSIVGFLQAAAVFSSFWSAKEKLRMVEHMRLMFSEGFMVAIETASSTVRNTSIPDSTLRDWRRYARRYTADGRPLGAMLLQEGYMRFIKSCATSLVGAQNLSDDELLDDYMDSVGIARSHDDAEISLVDRLTGIINDGIQLLEDGSDYLQVGSPWQQRLAFSVKALALFGYLNCIILSEDTANSDDFLSWLEDTLVDPNQMSCVELATTTLKCITVMSKMSVNSASSGSRSLLRFIVEGGVPAGHTGSVAAQCLSQVLGVLSQDSVITTLYSLGNALSPGSGTDKQHQGQPIGEPTGLALTSFQQVKNGSIASLSVSEMEDNTPYRSIVHAIVTIASNCQDEKISALAQSMLLQKIGKLNTTVDACIIKEAAALSLTTGQAEFQLLLKFYDRVYRDGVAKGYSNIVNAVLSAMTYLSVNLQRDSHLYRLYLLHLLESIVNKGDATDFENERHKEITFSPNDISPLLKPLALLVSPGKEKETLSANPLPHYDQDISTLFRDAWFNIAIHGITPSSAVGRNYFEELRLLAKHSPSLVSEDRMDMIESDLELNTILRRGLGPHRLAEQKKALMIEIPHREAEIKRLSYPKAVFLNAALLVETLRVLSGNCTKSLSYFRDPALATPEMASCMTAVVDKAVGRYLELTLSGKHENFSVAFLSKELAGFFAACCHRIERVQRVAILCANKIIKECPSALCEKHSLFALLELLTVMWRSCLEEELDEFEWKPSFTSPIGIVKVDLPDSYIFRKKTLDVFLERARAWVTVVMDIAPLDVKGLLQTYLSASDGHDGNGDISMGRSFALEMGSLIPQSDHRLGSIESYGVAKINMASDFIAQHTARQIYRRADGIGANGVEWEFFGNGSGSPESSPSLGSSENLEIELSSIHEKIKLGDQVSLVEIRDVLRQAAALLCGGNSIHAAIVYDLVSLPFRIFSKESINIGVSLWLGVMHENPQMEPRILVEVIAAWENSILRKQGFFDPSFDHVDPMYAKIELLPTDKALMLQQQKLAQNILAPHLQIIQFFESHFNAVRLGNAQTQQLFCRFIDRTTVGLLHASNHPLARELHFRIILFCLRVIRHCTPFDKITLWKLKHQILSAALGWFKNPPRWSFGGNRLQLKAEDKILVDVLAALASAASIGCNTRWPYSSLQAKQDLLHVLVENERSRLKVWLYPLEPDRKHATQSPLSKSLTEENMLRIAWAESPGLAIQLATRFPSGKLNNDIRRLLLSFPELVIDEPSSLEIMFDSALPADVSTQLKYLLYWAPVNPTEALTYFLPAYGNHPNILQYAMKALESHSLDVRFYFVPQLVQALRYDALGYVERYILETAKQSQLFAHQVIWNMKANSYKDEDSQIPDPLKPTLDSFMDTLVTSFTDEERDFYQREFSFFNEITDISGKLRPYIKKSKPEKKEKIEEELRKIKVEVGVYLPSNPEGVVVGIDRKSGKPLQSHAKAPYMATFRIQKTRTRWTGGAGHNPGPVAASKPNELTKSSPNHASNAHQETYEVWQSAIFKVGDDCRQDMLALQMIAAFRSIFSSVGLDVWVFPYRVTSTAPGCGVIDVLPNSISRDMLGREAVNGLYDYFVSKYGGEDSIRFQEARTNFVKSMAAYSVISYLLQFKDRHNGNIMFDDAGHIIHIDFGFCFDIAPGGVRFERAPFKLTSEMVAVMSGTSHSHASTHGGSGGGLLPGGSSNSPTNTQAYRWFESLVVKAFLASRPYCTKLTHIVSLMLDSGLPCFKPETLKHFRDRFVLDKNERDAAEYMRELVRKSYLSFSTKGYDQFQLMTNGIPY